MARVLTCDQPNQGPIICACLNVGLHRIRAAIGSGQATSIVELGTQLGAGSNCGSCRPPREDLDAIWTCNPIINVHQWGQLTVPTSKGLDLEGITADTPDPGGGVTQRKTGSRKPNGVLEETGLFFALPVLSATGNPVCGRQSGAAPCGWHLP